MLSQGDMARRERVRMLLTEATEDRVASLKTVADRATSEREAAAGKAAADKAASDEAWSPRRT